MTGRNSTSPRARAAAGSMSHTQLAAGGLSFLTFLRLLPLSSHTPCASESGFLGTANVCMWQGNSHEYSQLKVNKVNGSRGQPEKHRHLTAQGTEQFPQRHGPNQAQDTAKSMGMLFHPHEAGCGPAPATDESYSAGQKTQNTKPETYGFNGGS